MLAQYPINWPKNVESEKNTNQRKELFKVNFTILLKLNQAGKLFELFFSKKP
jgi:hypothetical protein